MYSMVSYAKLQWNFPNQQPLVLFVVNFLLVAFSCGTPQLSSGWVISNVSLSVYSTFWHNWPPLQASPYAVWSQPPMSATQLFFPQRIQNTVHWWNKMSLAAILSQWIVGTPVVCMCQTCVHTGEARCHYRYYIPHSTIYSTNMCNPTMIMTFSTPLVSLKLL